MLSTIYCCVFSSAMSSIVNFRFVLVKRASKPNVDHIKLFQPILTIRNAHLASLAVLATFATVMTRYISLLLATLACCPDATGCTSAIVSAQASASGRPLLWKNRDTSATDNKIEYIAASSPEEYDYVGLFNASDRNCEQAWMGMNSAGFAVMNTASYNLKDDNVPASKMDREGYVMSHALKHCRTVDDFGRLLDVLPRPMGVEANFGVIDACGNGAYFECNNHSYTRYNLDDAPDGVLVRTNYSHSGEQGKGYGQIRERNALHLLKPYSGNASVEPYTFTDVLSCSFYHDLYGRDMAETPGCQWLIDQDFIPRYTTTATVVIEGVSSIGPDAEGEPGRRYVMWTALGYPPCAQVVPVWCSPEGVDEGLRGLQPGGTSRLCDEAKARKQEVFSAPDGNRQRYIRLSTLKNSLGTGYLQHFRNLNMQTYRRMRRSNNLEK